MDADTASRLCNACGLCCNGVLFHNVRLQPAEVPQDFIQLGLHIQRKKGHHLFQQPCPAWCGSQCAIYLSRPERCRLFECRQLQRVAAGEITEAAALEKIRDVQARVLRITTWLAEAGSTSEKRPLSKRVEKILATPAFDPIAMELHQKLTREMADLDAVLDADFRLPQS
ncbi:MAG: YkgJ family cysteine cluster protein [Chthoniobacterales bacterium]